MFGRSLALSSASVTQRVLSSICGRWKVRNMALSFVQNIPHGLTLHANQVGRSWKANETAQKGNRSCYGNAFAHNVVFNFPRVFSITAKTTNSLNMNSHGWCIYGVLCSMFWHLTLKLSLLDWFLQKNKGSFIAATVTRYNRRHFSFQLLVIEMMTLATQKKQNRALLRESFIVYITRLPITGHASISNLTIKLGTASVICFHSSY